MFFASNKTKIIVDIVLPNGYSLNNHQVVTHLGEGAFSHVFLAKETKTGDTEAVKVCKTTISSDDLRRFHQENDILHQLKTHPRIIEPRTTVLTHGPYTYYSMEPMSSDLRRYLLNSPQLDIQEKIRLFKGIVDGLKHAHGRGVAHRDLWWDNVLIKIGAMPGVGEPKLTDFGRAKNFSAITSLNSGSPIAAFAYITPPEKHFGIYDPSDPSGDYLADIYALGIVLYYIIEVSPSHHANELFNSICDFAVIKNLSVLPTSMADKIFLYKEWLNGLKTPLANHLTVLSVSEKTLSDKINTLVSKMSHPDREKRHASVEEVMIELNQL